MPDDLDQLPTQELRERAFHRAERHLDVRFFWSLLEVMPAAEAASGDLREGQADVQRPLALVSDALREDDGRLAEALRPLYLDYLRRHADGA